MMGWIKREWSQISTKAGTALAMIGPLLQNYAQYDMRFAYASAAIGVGLILFREKSNG